MTLGSLSEDAMSLIENSAVVFDDVMRDHMPSNNAADSMKYVIPANIVLHALGIDKGDFNSDRVRVSTKALRKLIEYALLSQPVNETQYFDENPDVQAAVLAGELKSATQHYRLSGYYENRLPGPMGFDPEWYHATYADIAQAFSRSQREEIWEHFRSSGYVEGRAGCAEHLRIIKHWLEG